LFCFVLLLFHNQTYLLDIKQSQQPIYTYSNLKQKIKICELKSDILKCHLNKHGHCFQYVSEQDYLAVEDEQKEGFPPVKR
jgi:hypothetical protein